MRRPLALLLLLTLALAAAGCQDGVTAPPSGLPVTLEWLPLPTRGAPPPPPSLAGAGDSVLASAVVSTWGCYDYHADAGLLARTDVLIITLTGVQRGGICPDDLGAALVRVTVYRVPPGRHLTLWRERQVPAAGRVSETELARTTLTLP